MAQSARLVAPVPPLAPGVWPHHEVTQKSVPLHLLWKGNRRFEAESYIASGYGIRLAMEARAAGWKKIGQVAEPWTPPRIKSVLVDEEFGVPYLNTSQVFSVRANPRKWLSAEKTKSFTERLSEPGTILILASASPGRTTVTLNAHKRAIISHHFIRLTIKDESLKGWIYAYLSSQQGRAISTASQYGAIIQHIEPKQLADLPIPIVQPKIAARFQRKFEKIQKLRNEADELTKKAEKLFEDEIGKIETQIQATGYQVDSSEFAGRRRLDAAAHSPIKECIYQHFQSKKLRVEKLSSLGWGAWVPNRYKRIPASDGVDYFDSANLLETNPIPTKRFMDNGFGDEFGGRVRKGWVLIPSSGQVYGIIGQATLCSSTFDEQVFSNHVIRLAPKDKPKISGGYLTVALSHPLLGRPLIKSLPFGSSVPEIAVRDLENVEVVRLPPKIEDRISSLAEKASENLGLSNQLENEMAAEAGKLVDRFLEGDVEDFVVTMPVIAPETSSPGSGSFAEYAVVRLCKAIRKAGLKAGAVGAIVHVYGKGEAYEVEFPDAKEGYEVLTLKPSDIEAT